MYLVSTGKAIDPVHELVANFKQQREQSWTQPAIPNHEQQINYPNSWSNSQDPGGAGRERDS
jgi:hypothetical protein